MTSEHNSDQQKRAQAQSTQQAWWRADSGTHEQYQNTKIPRGPLRTKALGTPTTAKVNDQPSKPPATASLCPLADVATGATVVEADARSEMGLSCESQSGKTTLANQKMAQHLQAERVQTSDDRGWRIAAWRSHPDACAAHALTSPPPTTTNNRHHRPAAAATTKQSSCMSPSENACVPARRADLCAGPFGMHGPAGLAKSLICNDAAATKNAAFSADHLLRASGAIAAMRSESESASSALREHAMICELPRTLPYAAESPPPELLNFISDGRMLFEDSDADSDDGDGALPSPIHRAVGFSSGHGAAHALLHESPSPPPEALNTLCDGPLLFEESDTALDDDIDAVAVPGFWEDDTSIGCWPPCEPPHACSSPPPEDFNIFSEGPLLHEECDTPSDGGNDLERLDSDLECALDALMSSAVADARGMHSDGAPSRAKPSGGGDGTDLAHGASEHMDPALDGASEWTGTGGRQNEGNEGSDDCAGNGNDCDGDDHMRRAEADLDDVIDSVMDDALGLFDEEGSEDDLQTACDGGNDFAAFAPAASRCADEEAPVDVCGEEAACGENGGDVDVVPGGGCTGAGWRTWRRRGGWDWTKARHTVVLVMSGLGSCARAHGWGPARD